jgi:oxygen-independent coproporphyrinogen-3 oxidase
MEMALGSPQPVDTIFVGGGTPTRLDPSQLSRLMAMIRNWLPLTSRGEWTVEANPGTLDLAKVEILVEAGVDRISLGAQSFQPALLRSLERNHQPEEVERAVELVRPRFSRWSLDLIFGVPGSTVDHWKADLDRALSLSPSHLSCYGLVYEKGTALWNQRRAGQVEPVDEEVERAMYEHTIDRLASDGLSMYEISNFARSGCESRHNLVYWANEAYFGFGLGAARYIDGVRSVNTRDLPGYLRRVEARTPPNGPIEQLEPESRARETAMLMMRRVRIGLDRTDFLKRTGFELDVLAGSAIERFVSRGMLEDDGRRVRFTREGLFLADEVLCELL